MGLTILDFSVNIYHHFKVDRADLSAVEPFFLEGCVWTPDRHSHFTTPLRNMSVLQH